MILFSSRERHFEDDICSHVTFFIAVNAAEMKHLMQLDANDLNASNRVYWTRYDKKS